jgi:hypothetical protein
MTTPTPATGLRRLATASVRELAVWALLGYAGLIIVFALLHWLIPASPDGIGARSYFADFVDVFTIALPVLAVLLAARVSSPLPAAQLVALIALAEYAAVLLFGLLALLAGLPYAFGHLGSGVYALGGTLDALGYLVLGVARLALVAVAGLTAWRIFGELGGRLPGLGRPAPED